MFSSRVIGYAQRSWRAAGPELLVGTRNAGGAMLQPAKSPPK
jgi:hypothetical protein